MEQSNPGKCHDHIVLVGGGDHMVVTDGAAGLGDVLDPGFESPLHVVAKGEEGIAAQGDPLQSGVKYIAQPGGSIRDDQVIATADKHDMVMAFTGMRLFHH